MYIAGKAQHCKRHTIRQNHARHAYSDHAHKASPIIDTTHPIIEGTGFKAEKFWAKKKPPAMQKAQRAEFQGSRSLRRKTSAVYSRASEAGPNCHALR
jgi:hypothetical protein